MIRIADKQHCCGCGACVQVCPRKCIVMQEDEQGFMYPVVDAGVCVECGLCERVCPVINRGEARRPLSVLAAKNPDAVVRNGSSSGGVFTMLAEQVIDAGGVVFGARFNDKLEVVHDYVESRDGLAAFRGSKYVQSRIGDCFRTAESFLESGRQVLFSGTPCQIAGLRRYLRKDYPNLLAVDIVCHGAPSPKVWRDYLACVADSKAASNSPETTGRITSVNFRDKSRGWRNYRVVLHRSEANADSQLAVDEYYGDNVYMRGFLRNLYLRPSCYHCPAREGRSGSDVMLGDFWGVERTLPTFYDNRGVSLVTANTDTGCRAVSELAVDSMATDYSTAVSGNPSIVADSSYPEEYGQFWQEYSRDGISALNRLATKLPNSSRFCRKFIRAAYRIFVSRLPGRNP